MLLTIQTDCPAIDLHLAGEPIASSNFSVSLTGTDSRTAIRTSEMNPIAKFQLGSRFGFGMGRSPNLVNRIQTNERTELFTSPNQSSQSAIQSSGVRQNELDRDPLYYSAYSFAPRNQAIVPDQFEQLSQAYLGRDISKPRYSFLESGPTP